MNSITNRRTFLKSSLLTAAALGLPRWAKAQATGTNSDVPYPLRLPALTENSMVPGRKRLPDWMRVPRWFTQDPTPRRIRNAGDTRELVRRVAANGGEVLRLGCFEYGEAFFQSAVAPHSPGLEQVDYLREAVDEGALVGVKIVMYMNPNALYQRDPLFESCAVRDAEGRIAVQEPYGVTDIRYACINNPVYRKFLSDLLTEIFTQYKPDGLYVDGLSPHSCFCEHCRRKYQEMFGQPMPVEKFKGIKATATVWAEFGADPQPVGDVENDPDARRWTEMFYQTLGEATHAFWQTVKTAKPDALTMFHSHPKPNCAECYDGTLTEVFSPRPWVHIAWQTGEMAGYSNVYPVPVLCPKTRAHGILKRLFGNSSGAVRLNACGS
jgi:proteasome lid subunit RPN8/RPN11